MKKIIIPSVIQFLIVFLIIGGIAYFVRGDFFFRFLAPIFGLAAGLLRLASRFCILNYMTKKVRGESSSSFVKILR